MTFKTHTHKPLDESRFSELLESYGAHFESWPEQEGKAAKPFLKTAPAHILRAVEDARLLDRLLNTSAAPAPSSHLFERILAATPQRKTGFWSFLTLYKLRIIAMSLSLTFGLTTGAGAYTLFPKADPWRDVMITLAFDDGSTILDEGEINP